MSDLLIAKIARRAANRHTQIDMGDMLSEPKRVSPPLQATEAIASEAALGFPVPLLLKRLYKKVGNGGFGPGYGLIGLHGGALDDQGKNAVELYELYAAKDPNDPEWNWPDGLLPICHWGCAIYSCIDCKCTDNPIITFDPDLQDQSWAQCFLRTNHTLESWLSAWAAGTKLWDEMYRDWQDA